MAEMVHGQLYRVGLTARGDGDTAQIECLIVAASVEDARVRFPYLFDMSGYEVFRIDYVTKEPSRCMVLKTKFERTPITDPADIVVKRDAGSQDFFQRIEQIGHKFDVHATATLFAKDANHATKKLAERILGGSEKVKTVAVLATPTSPYATAKDQSHFQRATFVRG